MEQFSKRVAPNTQALSALTVASYGTEQINFTVDQHLALMQSHAIFLVCGMAIFIVN